MKKFQLLLICLYPIKLFAAQYEDPVEAFVVGALSWLFLFVAFYMVRWIIRQSREYFHAKQNVLENHINNECAEPGIKNNVATMPNSPYNQTTSLSPDMSSPIDGTIRFCKNCGKAIDPDSNYCPYCGKLLKQIVKTFFPPQGKTYSDADKPINSKKDDISVIKGFDDSVSLKTQLSHQDEQLLDELRYEKEYVDLGLSVKWGICNVGSSINNPVGGLYGWGDSSGLKTSGKTTDYIRKIGGLYIATPQNISGTEDDIARAKWGKNWCMPTRKHWEELVRRCSWEKTSVFGVDGYKVTGTNGNFIFLPFTGNRYGNEMSLKNAGCYWTSELLADDNAKAYYMYFDNYCINRDVNASDFLYLGYAIRPIYIV